jgi:pimeloyl-ACP methyl ester carboxylesterase
VTTGARVVLLHGALSDARMWTPLVARLAAKGVVAEAPPMAGFHPDRFDAATFSSAAHVATLGAALEAADRPIHLVGHSRGGRLALAIAAAYPELVGSLLLIEPGGITEPDYFVTPPPAAPLDRDMLHVMVGQGRHEAAARLYIDAGHGTGAWDGAPEDFRRVACDNAATLPGTLADRTVPLSRTAAAAVGCRTLLVTGSASPPLFDCIADVLERNLPRCRRLRLAGQDHFYPQRAADHLADLLLRWIGGEDVAAS